MSVVLARPAVALPGAGWAFEPKLDGWRGLLTARRLVSRHGTDLSRRFPELLGQVPAGTVLDGEIVCWSGGRLDFAGLQRRPRKASVGFMVFDVLEHDGTDLRPRPYRERRALLERTELAPPLSVVDSTTDPAQALSWWEAYRPFGVEGLVAKRLDDPYRPGQRDWLKLRSRHPIDTVVVATAGTGLVLAAADDPIRRPVALSLPLGRNVADQLATTLHPAGDTILVQLGLPGQPPVEARPVQPLRVEVVSDGVLDGGRHRHGVRVVRVRTDVPVPGLRP